MTTPPLINLSDLVRILRLSLYAMILMELLYGVHSWQLRGFIEHVMAGDLTQAEIDARAEAIDSMGLPVGIGYSGAFVICVILSAVWIVRAGKNAAMLVPDSKRITPGWAVGWYCIPFASLWMPYKAMRQIYNSSVTPPAALDAPAPALLKWWWWGWLISNIIALYTARAFQSDTATLQQMQNATDLDIANAPLSAISVWLWLQVVQTITRLQQSTRISADAAQSLAPDEAAS